jgi:flagellar biosynthesis/type III secretory pathway M-ring protein FliF/YscJ
MAAIPGGEAPPAALAEPPAPPDVVRARLSELDDEILELARSNPKKVPLVLRSWMES